MKTLTIIYKENIVDSFGRIIKKGCHQILNLDFDKNSDNPFIGSITTLVNEISKGNHLRFTLV